MTHAEPLLEVRNLKKYFPIRRGIFKRKVGDVQAVDGVTFTIRRGETLGLVGESGCGKSTTGRTILQLLAPTGGDIQFKGRDLTTLPEWELRLLRQDMQIIFQDPYASLNPRMTVGAILSEPFEIQDINRRRAELLQRLGSGFNRVLANPITRPPAALIFWVAQMVTWATTLNAQRRRRQEVRDKVKELLELVGLSAGMVNRYPHEFSGGQRQRIGIARALATNPDFIVADEPISALDVSIQAQIVNLLDDLKAELGLTYLFIAHDLSMVRYMSDRVAVMYLGRIVELSDADRVYEQPLHPYTQALISANPIPDPKRERRRNPIILEGDVPSPANPPRGCRFNPRCRFATDICRTDDPQLRELGTAQTSHMVACHHAEQFLPS